MNEENQPINDPEKMDFKKWKTEIQNGTISDDCLFRMIKNIEPLRNHILLEAAQFILSNHSLILSQLETRLRNPKKEH